MKPCKVLVDAFDDETVKKGTNERRLEWKWWGRGQLCGLGWAGPMHCVQMCACNVCQAFERLGLFGANGIPFVYGGRICFLRENKMGGWVREGSKRRRVGSQNCWGVMMMI